MRLYSHEFPIERMATVLEVSRSGYYAWRESPTRISDEKQKAFDDRVNRAFKERKQRYGCVRMTEELRHAGVPCSRNRVARSMRRQGLRARPTRTFVATTTDSRHPYRVAKNLLQRTFQVENPNHVWVTDIAYLSYRDGWLYLVIFLDLYARKIVGWHVSHSLKHEAVLVAFDRAVGRRGSIGGLLVHSDRGIQYCCDGFRSRMQSYGVRQSMSRKGPRAAGWDNAVAESFFATLKKELPTGMVFTNLEEAERYLFEYIKIDYNTHHFHSTLGYYTPVEYENQYWNKECVDARKVA